MVLNVRDFDPSGGVPPLIIGAGVSIKKRGSKLVYVAKCSVGSLYLFISSNLINVPRNYAVQFCIHFYGDRYLCIR